MKNRRSGSHTSQIQTGFWYYHKYAQNYMEQKKQGVPLLLENSRPHKIIENSFETQKNIFSYLGINIFLC